MTATIQKNFSYLKNVEKQEAVLHRKKIIYQGRTVKKKASSLSCAGSQTQKKASKQAFQYFFQYMREAAGIIRPKPECTTFCNKRFGMFRGSVKPQYMMTCNIFKRYLFHLIVFNASSLDDSIFTSNNKVSEETSYRCSGSTYLCSSALLNF